MAKHFGTRRFIVQPNVSSNESLLSEKYPTAFNAQDASLQSSRLRSTNNLYFDPKSAIVRRPTSGEPVVYEQKIFLRFLQPPAIPPPGPLIIKEVRPAQPPPPPPLIVRQRAPPLPAQPPLILRERPPIPPAPVASQTIIRHLPPLPSPPRSVVIERLPSLPARPRDILIERWIPYGPQAKRRTIIQRAPLSPPYPPPRNLIILYDPTPVRMVRQFRRFDSVQADPRAYLSRYGSSLLDTDTLIRTARAAGVTEDTSPPLEMSSDQFDSSTAFRLRANETNIIPFDRASTISSQGFLTTNFDDLGINNKPGIAVFHALTSPRTF